VRGVEGPCVRVCTQVVSAVCGFEVDCEVLSER